MAKKKVEVSLKFNAGDGQVVFRNLTRTLDPTKRILVRSESVGFDPSTDAFVYFTNSFSSFIANTDSFFNASPGVPNRNSEMHFMAEVDETTKAISGQVPANMPLQSGETIEVDVQGFGSIKLVGPLPTLPFDFTIP